MDDESVAGLLTGKGPHSASQKKQSNQKSLEKKELCLDQAWNNPTRRNIGDYDDSLSQRSLCGKLFLQSMHGPLKS